ncbi:MAG: class I SAM-dependent methyltransferase [Planctomycetes bacterium]|nr:class I SAM-dependent methyltransferase [Planctomycetota bacterium]
MHKILENGAPAGNLYDKYNTKNPVARYMMNNFLDSASAFLLSIKDDIDSITEVGCGEGHLANHIHSLGITEKISCCDFSEQVIDIARKNYQNTNIRFYQKDIYHIGPEEMADLIVCCEVLEHLEEPEKALEKIVTIAGKYCLLSVPNEPLWKVLNLCRGKYIRHLGNTPGHINHWNSGEFVNLISQYFEVIGTKKPLPWTMVLCKKR